MNNRITLTIPEAVQVSGMSRSSLYVAMQRGDLVAKKAGKRTLIAVSDLEEYLSALPNYRGES